jgi:HlyD family secretion protein
MRNFISRMHVAIFCFSIAGLSCLGCSSDSNQDNAKTPTSSSAELPKVATAKPVRKEIAQRTEQPGQIEAFMITPVHAKVGGFVEKLLVEIGDHVVGPKLNEKGDVVEPGQLLAVLVAPELSDELQQKQAMIQQSRADIEQSQAAVRVAESMAASADANIDECLAGQQRVEAAYERWNSELSRVRSLVATQTVTQKLADEALEQFKSADAARGELSAKLRSAKAKKNEALIAVEKSKADLRSTEAHSKVAEADFHRVESMREYLQIRAPFDGVVTHRSIELGTLVQPARSSQDDALFVVVDSKRLRVFVDVPESDAGLVDNGRKAIVRVPSLNGRSVEATVSRTSWALQSSTRALRCEIDILNEEGVIRPGMYANVEVIVSEKKDVMTVPKGAVIQRDGASICLAVDPEGTLVRKPVTLGIRSSSDIEITSGLDGTENVITANTNAFKDGQKVQKVEPVPQSKIP